jgi:peptide/nickel transport system substrate-binding protein
MGDQIRRTLSRRAMLRLTGSAASLALAAACAPITPPAPTAAPKAAAPAAPPPAAPAAPTASALPAGQASPAAQAAAQPSPAAAQPKPGGTLRMGFAGNLANLDGHLITAANYDTIYMVYDRLTEYDADLKPQPRLAESWELSPDARQIKVNLRKGVTFHSGREFTSEDVKYNLLRVRDPKTASPQLAPMSNWWTEIQTPDKNTIVLKSEQPRPAVFDMFELMNMIDRETTEGPNAGTKVVGTGPFAMTEYMQGDHLTFVKNKDYWRSGRPYLDGVNVQLAKDQAALMVQLEAGALDSVDQPSIVDAVRLREDKNFQLYQHERSGTTWLLAANTKMPPTDNKQVRQALNYAIDRKRALEVVMKGIGESRSTPWPPTSPAYDASLVNSYAYDLDKAKSLLAAAGASNIEMDISFRASTSEYNNFAQLYQADLAKIGVKANVKPTEDATFLNAMNEVSYRGVVVNLVGYSNLGDPSTFFNSGRTYNYNLNIAGYKSEQYTQLVTSVTVESDATKRKSLLDQLNKLMLDDCFIMTIGTQPAMVLSRSNVRGMRKLTSQFISYVDVSLA